MESSIFSSFFLLCLAFSSFQLRSFFSVSDFGGLVLAGAVEGLLCGHPRGYDVFAMKSYIYLAGSCETTN